MNPRLWDLVGGKAPLAGRIPREVLKEVRAKARRVVAQMRKQGALPVRER